MLFHRLLGILNTHLFFELSILSCRHLFGFLNVAFDFMPVLL